MEKRSLFQNSMRIFCIGIGGIGLSALACYYKHEGHEVTGSDKADSPLIAMLRKEGISVSIGEEKDVITDDITMVVYTIAIADSNSQFIRAKELGIICKTYPEALGEITKEKKTIAICGTHGKTTTTAMMYYALKACGINPTVIIGSLLSGTGTNFIAGDSDYMVVEACEYKRSFLNLHPTHVLVTNIDEDHLDYYKDIHDIHDAFQSFAHNVPLDGYLVTHTNVSLETNGKKLDADCVDKKDIELSVLGEHNKTNAQLVIALCQELGLPDKKVRDGLKAFKGTWRRLEYKGTTNHGVKVFDDYGHHPKELEATISALRTQYKKGEYTLHVFFQPHLYSRTKMFLSDFAKVLADVDMVYVMPIYASREKEDVTISSNMLVQEIQNLGGHAELCVKEEMSHTIESITDQKSIVLNIGAGDAYLELDKVSYV